MDKKKLSMALLLVPIVVVLLVFISNAYLGAQLQVDPDRFSEETMGYIQLTYGVLGLASLVCALVGGILFIAAMRPPKGPKA